MRLPTTTTVTPSVNRLAIAIAIAIALRKAALMKLLVLGGTRFVGRAVVGAALDRDWDVTAIHRGVTGTLPDGVTVLHADRTSEAALAAAIGDGHWDAVIDTWSGAPRLPELPPDCSETARRVFATCRPVPSTSGASTSTSSLRCWPEP